MAIYVDSSLDEKVYIFEDRWDAGQKLAKFVSDNLNIKKDLVVLAIPNGGIPIGKILANVLGAEFDIIVVRKIPIPWEPEAGFGAVTADGEPIIDEFLAQSLGLTKDVIDELVEKVREKIVKRIEMYRRYIKPVEIDGKNVIITDDGLATGYTMFAAVKSVKNRASKVFVATPTASRTALENLAREVDAIFCLNVRTGIPYFAVADAYINWRDLSDEEVIDILKGSD